MQDRFQYQYLEDNGLSFFLYQQQGVACCSVAVEVVQHKIVQIGPLIQKESDNLYKLGINAAGYI